jgi:hypothetical protein
VPAGEAHRVVIGGQKHIHGALFGAGQVERIEGAETESFEKRGTACFG